MTEAASDDWDGEALEIPVRVRIQLLPIRQKILCVTI